MSKFTHEITHALNGDLLINSTHPACNYICSINLNDEMSLQLNNILASVESTMTKQTSIDDLVEIKE